MSALVAIPKRDDWAEARLPSSTAHHPDCRNRPDDAERLFEQLLAIDPGNSAWIKRYTPS